MKYRMGWAALIALIGLPACEPATRGENAAVVEDGETDAGNPRDAVVTSGCGDSAPCVLGEVCVDGMCRDEDMPCDPACGPGTHCYAGQCVNDCSEGSCPPGEVCDADTGECVEDGCESVTCPEGFHCELDGMGGERCVSDGGDGTCEPDCGPNEVCREGICHPNLGGRDDECNGDEDCPPGFVCDTDVDPTICREPEDQPWCEGERWDPEVCCQINESCCRCDGTPEERQWCELREAIGEVLCPPSCDCNFIETCSPEELVVCFEQGCNCAEPSRVDANGAFLCSDQAACQCVCGDVTYGRFCDTVEERAICEGPGDACSCADRDLVGLCGDDAGCACICGDPDFGRFCSPQQCVPPAECNCETGENCEPNECACNCDASRVAVALFCGPDECEPPEPVCVCDDPTTWETCGGIDDDGDGVVNTPQCDTVCNYRVIGIRIGNESFGFRLSAVNGRLGPACAETIGAEVWSGTVIGGQDVLTHCDGSEPEGADAFCRGMAQNWGYRVRYIRGNQDGGGSIVIPLMANQCLEGGGQGDVVSYGNATFIQAARGTVWPGCGGIQGANNIPPNDPRFVLGTGIRTCVNPSDGNAYPTMWFLPCLPGHEIDHDGGPPR